MKREILFRGKRVDNGEWVEGYLVKIFDGRAFIIPEKSGCFRKSPYIPYRYEVIPETVGQYTNLHDRGANKIFEGDKDDEGNVVEFVNGSWCLNGDGPIYDYHIILSGNIHETPNSGDHNEIKY